MKQKFTNIVLILALILGSILIVPDIVHTNHYILKEYVLLIGGAFLLIILLSSYKKIKLDKKDILLLSFLLLIVISTLLSSNIKTSILGAKNRCEGLLMFITYACIYFTSKKLFKYEDKNELLTLLFFACMGIGILGIAQKYVSFAKLYPIFNKGIGGTFGNSNFFGSFISIVLPISICTFVFKGSKKGFLLSLVMFFNLISSGTRSAWVAFIIGTFFFLIYLIKQKNKGYFKKTVILLILFVLIFMYLFGSFKAIIKKINPEKKETKTVPVSQTQIKVSQVSKEIKEAKKTGSINKMGSGRIEIWKMTIKLILQKPIFGCGTDNLRDGLHEYCQEDITQYVKRARVDIDKAHNEYLQIAATIGVPALIIYLLFLSLIVFPKMKIMFKNEIIFIITLTIICYLAQAFFNISTIGVAPIFWMLLGLSDNKEMLDILYLKSNK